MDKVQKPSNSVLMAFPRAKLKTNGDEANQQNNNQGTVPYSKFLRKYNNIFNFQRYINIHHIGITIQQIL
jgi:hypothetical protein